MHKYLVTTLAVCSLWGGAAQSEVITFDGLAFDAAAPYPEHKFSTITVGDYVFTALDASTPLIVKARNDPDNADPAGATLGLRTSGSAQGFTLTRVDGGTFDISAFDATHLSNSLTSPGNFGSLNVYLDGVLGLHTSYDTNPGFQSFSVASNSVTSVRITSDNFFQIDNINVQPTGRTLPVPEAATWALMVAGFGMVGATMRRTRLKARFA